ncbi:MAG: PQQ-dependent sugar dehydrogenase [Pseudomonadota bacterium]
MHVLSKLSLCLSIPAAALASCALAESGESAAEAAERVGYTIEEIGTFERPWAIEFVPGANTLAIAEKAGTLKLMRMTSGEIRTVNGTPEVDFGGQGGLGDIAFLPGEETRADGRTVYLSWAEAGEGDTRGAAVGRGLIVCERAADACELKDFEVIWRQTPKVTGKGHYSHRIQISPDGQYLFIASGDRQKQTPAQDTTNTLGTVVRLNLDGTPADGNPMADKGGVTAEIWSWGHRNILGMDWDAQGRLWETEHGPAGGRVAVHAGGQCRDLHSL